NKPTTQYPSTPGFISNHWYGRWGQVTLHLLWLVGQDKLKLLDLAARRGEQVTALLHVHEQLRFISLKC
ncbi:hypothetical protein LLE56_17350, partial [Xanthomonas campestris]|uniref:hypothetical protein n=1 Tax=Xanthomonas campestris TaxID=339 RepID=UPI001E5B1A2F